ncbi:MAG: flavodoxin family protein [Chloroflexota bacterium]|nr:MAG: flavodoxin family protein [Chloroflexota bacterium]
MKSLVVYFSKFGHTQQIAERISSELANHGTVNTISSDQLVVEDLKDVDLVVMGTPTHNMNLPEAVRPVFEQLPKRILRGMPVAAFDTSYKMSAFLSRFTAAKKLARKLRKLGGKRIVPPETFHVVARQGPLYEGELERAQDWASSIMAVISQ